MSKRDEAGKLLWESGLKLRMSDVNGILDALAPLLEDEPEGEATALCSRCERTVPERACMNEDGVGDPVCDDCAAEALGRAREPAPDGEWLDVARKALFNGWRSTVLGEAALPMHERLSVGEVLEYLAPLARRDAEQRAEIERLEAKEIQLRTALQSANNRRTEQRAEIERLRERLDDHEDDFRAVMDETCASSDEVHCSCVPHLRAEIERLRECMRQAGLAAFMKGRDPAEVGDHLRGVLASYTDEIERLRAERDVAPNHEDWTATQMRDPYVVMAAFGELNARISTLEKAHAGHDHEVTHWGPRHKCGPARPPVETK